MGTSRKQPAAAASLSLAFGLARWAALPAPAAKVLVIYGNSNGTVTEGNYSLGDAWVKQRLETALHHQVRFLWDQTAKAAMLAAADSSDLVVVLESVTSAYLTDKLKTARTPILYCEAMIQDDMGMTAKGTGGDPGPPSQYPYGVVDSAKDILIRDPAHPLAVGLQGLVHVYSANKEINWGKVASTAHVVATLPSDTAGATLYVYEKGDKLFDGTAAAGMRIGFFLEDDNKTGTAPFLTPEGVALFDESVAYGLGKPATALDRRAASPQGPGSGGAGIPKKLDALGRRAAGKARAPVWRRRIPPD
jgi:hypothetical protein